MLKLLAVAEGEREGGVAWLPEPSSSPDLELDLFLFTLQPRREIFKSAVECVCVTEGVTEEIISTYKLVV